MRRDVSVKTERKTEKFDEKNKYIVALSCDTSIIAISFV